MKEKEKKKSKTYEANFQETGYQPMKPRGP